MYVCVCVCVIHDKQSTVLANESTQFKGDCDLTVVTTPDFLVAIVGGCHGNCSTG